MEVASDGSSGDFLTPGLNLPLQFSSCDPWRFFCQSNHPPHGAWGQFTDRSSSRLIPYISCRFELLNYCPDCGNGYFQLLRYFLISFSGFLQLNNFLSHFDTVFFCLSHLDEWLRVFGLCHLIFIPEWNRKSWLTTKEFLIKQVNLKM